MSELIQKAAGGKPIRWRLLTGASAVALSTYVSSAAGAYAEEPDQPQVWIEVGGQLSRLQNSEEVFAPTLMDGRPSIFATSQQFEKPPLYSIDEDGKISIRPKNSSWIFSAAIRYGRSASKKHVSQQTNNPYPFYKYAGAPPTYPYHYARKFAETISRNTDEHAILDFNVGRDVGLGMFGKEASSTISLGVRLAQFKSTSDVTLRSNPDWAVHTKYVFSVYKFPIQNYHSNAASFNAQRSFHGVGPSLSWDASASVVGNPNEGELTFDWGVNAAVLFGKQKTRTHHQTTGRYHYWYPSHQVSPRPITYQGPTTPDHLRSKSVTVPNVGGFAGLSFRYAAAKVSFGYRADFFFGAMDGGIDARKSEDVGFQGPFATVSIGLGG